MAKENENIEENIEESIGIKDEPKKSINPKVFMIGLPLFVLQLIIVYFVTANILLTKFESAPLNENEGEVVESEDTDQEGEDGGAGEFELGKFVYSIDDIIVNPISTNGQRLLLVSLGFDLTSEENLLKLSDKEMVVKDMVISTLSSKSLAELGAVGQKDSLKVELSENLTKIMPSVKINRVYFSKYVIN